MKTQNDKVSEEVRELVYSDYNNKYEQLKAELKEIEKGCKKRITYQDISTKCGEEIGDIGITFKVYCPTCQAKIEYLKKGISACEEILNSQQINGKNTYTSPIVPLKNSEPLEIGCDGELPSADTLRGSEDGE